MHPKTQNRAQLNNSLHTFLPLKHFKSIINKGGSNIMRSIMMGPMGKTNVHNLTP